MQVSLAQASVVVQQIEQLVAVVELIENYTAVVVTLVLLVVAAVLFVVILILFADQDEQLQCVMPSLVRKKPTGSQLG